MSTISDTSTDPRWHLHSHYCRIIGQQWGEPCCCDANDPCRPRPEAHHPTPQAGEQA